jgi:hypothetical protein
MGDRPVIAAVAVLALLGVLLAIDAAARRRDPILRRLAALDALTRIHRRILEEHRHDRPAD